MPHLAKKVTFTTFPAGSKTCHRTEMTGYHREDTSTHLDMDTHSAVLRFLETVDPGDVYAILEERKQDVYDGRETMTTTIYYRVRDRE